MPYAIVINVPEARDECLVVMPFSGFDRLFDDVNAAAVGIPQLKACRAMSGEREHELDFPQEVVSAIRSARLVVGICSNDGDAAVPNPNVMYEVGLAHSMGKPTLLVTCSELPANIRSKHAFIYHPDEIGTRQLRQSLQIRMSALVRDDNVLTDPRHRDIHVADERHVMFHNPVFWDHFRTSLSFAKLIHDEHQLLETSWVHPFRTQVSEAMKKSPDERHGTVLDAWMRSLGFFETFTTPNVYAGMRELFAKVDESFVLMRRSLGTPLRDEVETCHTFYTDLRKTMTQYPDQFRSLAETLGSQEFASGSPQALARVVSQVTHISSETTHLIVWSDRLIVNLVGLIQRPKD